MTPTRTSIAWTLVALLAAPVLGAVCALAMCGPSDAGESAEHCGAMSDPSAPGVTVVEDDCCDRDAMPEAVAVSAKKEPLARPATLQPFAASPRLLASERPTATDGAPGGVSADLVLLHETLLL